MIQETDRLGYQNPSLALVQGSGSNAVQAGAAASVPPPGQKPDEERKQAAAVRPDRSSSFSGIRPFYGMKSSEALRQISSNAAKPEQSATAGQTPGLSEDAVRLLDERSRLEKAMSTSDTVASSVNSLLGTI
jgi:hypothetical protein